MRMNIGIAHAKGENLKLQNQIIQNHITVRANNCFHCWFLFMLEIKIKLIYKYRNNLSIPANEIF